MGRVGGREVSVDRRAGVQAGQPQAFLPVRGAHLPALAGAGTAVRAVAGGDDRLRDAQAGVLRHVVQELGGGVVHHVVAHRSGPSAPCATAGTVTDSCGTSGKSSRNAPTVTRCRTTGSASSNSSCRVSWVCPNVPS